MTTPLANFDAAIVALPILVAMFLFKPSILRLLDTKYMPGIFSARILQAVLFLSCGNQLPHSMASATAFSDILTDVQLTLLLIGLLVTAILVASINAKTKSNQAMYPQLRTSDWTTNLILGNFVTWAFYLFGYEYFFRESLLGFTAGNVTWTVTIFINVALYALAHLFKGPKEFFLSIPFGVLLCYLSLESGTFLPAFGIHCVLALSNDWFGILYQQKTKRIADVRSFVLITGASAGIGKALAHEFAARGKNLLLVSLPGSGLQDVAEQLTKEFGVVVHTLCIDLTRESAHKEVASWCRNNLYYIDTLVNNAGFGNLKAFDKTNANVLRSMLALNNTALVNLTHELIPELKKFRQSYIMNVGSLASFMPIPNKSLYAATKSFVYTFSQSLYYELRSSNIHVSCLCPGGTLTERVRSEMSEKNLKRNAFCQSPEEVAKTGVSGLYEKRFRIIPGWYNRVLFWLSQILPDFVKIQLITLAFRTDQPKAGDLRISVSYFKSYALFKL
jgi:uncharacterized protein